MYETQLSSEGESLFEVRNRCAPEEPDPLKESLRRAEDERRRAENRLSEASGRWDRERDRLRGEIADLTTMVNRLRSQGEENEDLKRRVEQTNLEIRQLKLERDQKAEEADSRSVALKKRIDELEQQIVEVLSRSGNDHRRVQVVEERCAAELEVARRRIEIEHEQQLRISEVHWKKEVRTLEKEIERLRKEVVRRPPTLLQRFRTRES